MNFGQIMTQNIRRKKENIYLLQNTNHIPKVSDLHDQQEQRDLIMLDITQDKEALSQLQELAETLIKEKTPAFERQALIRNAALDLKLSLRDGEIYKLIAKARAKVKGKFSGELPNQELDIPEESWLWDQLISDRTLTLITALQKVGKSSLVSAFFGCLTYGSKEFLGQAITGEKRPIIIVGTDQPLSDWSKILVPCGLMKNPRKGKAIILNPIVRLWHKSNPLHLDEKGIEEIVQLAERKENKNSIVLLDAFASLISGLGLDENRAEATEPIRFLLEALPSDATPILLHHSSKSRSAERASNAARGTNALTAEASQIIKMDWFSSDEHDQRISISTQGRNSTPVDFVFEQIERSQWINLGSSRSVAQKEKLAQKEADLSERQGDALEKVRDYWRENYKGINAKQLQEEYPEHFDTDKKALATLKQLTDKGFLQSHKTSLQGKGDVRLFQPSV
tara:strand:- start:229 stop:1587 length:1359 start_codon:yes stop_codon:yes gene_type:complete